MKLIFMRHGIAIERETPGCPPEYDRYITSEGREELEKEIRGICALKIKFDRVLSSPLVRAWQTAEIVVRSQKKALRIDRCDALAPGKDFAELTRILRVIPDDSTVLLTGHEPDISHTVCLICYGRILDRFSLKKGAMACVEVGGWEPVPIGALRWLLPPRLLIEAGKGRKKLGI